MCSYRVKNLVLVMLVFAFAMCLNAQEVFFSEDFSAGFDDQNWEKTGYWVIADTYSGGNFSGNYASNPGAWGFDDDDLISPPIDCSGIEEITLAFDHNLNDMGWEATVSVSISTDKVNWTSLYTHSAGSVGPENLDFDISAYADDESAIYIKWNFTTGWASFSPSWAVDNVTLSGTLAAEGLPGVAHTPTPVDGSLANVDVGLSWALGEDTDEVRVLFGTVDSPVDVVYDWGTPISSLTNSEIGGPLLPGRSYFWRVESKNEIGQRASSIFSFHIPFSAGTYSIIPAGGGDFASLTDVIGKLNTAGIEGPVVFELASATYVGPFNFVGEISGSSETNTITFRSADPENPALFQRSSSTFSDRATVLLSGAKHLIFDQLAFNFLTQNNWAIHLRDASNNIKITNNRFNQRFQSQAASIVSIVASNSNTNITTVGNNVKILLIEGNTFRGQDAQRPNTVISLYGSSADYITDLVIRNNTFNEIHTRAIQLNFVDAYEISNNEIEMWQSGSTVSRALDVVTSIDGFQIIGNRIWNARQYGLHVNSHTAPNDARAVIANNVFGGGYTNTLAANIRFNFAVYDIDIIYNSFLLDSHSTSNSACLHVNNASTTGLSVFNNSFAYTGGANNFGATVFATNPSLAFSEGIDYNNYFSNGNRLALYGATVYTVAEMVSVHGNDYSHQGDPNYENSHSLIPEGTQLFSRGKSILGFDKDIEGKERDSDNPSIGAYEIELLEKDLAATAITGPATVNVGVQTNFEIAVTNFGNETQNSYTVKLMKVSVPDPVLIGSIQATTSIATAETAVFDFSYTAIEGLENSDIELFGIVSLTGDSNPSNDQTEMKTVTVYPRDLMLPLETFTQAGVPAGWTAEAPWVRANMQFMWCLDPNIGAGNTRKLITPPMDSREAEAVRVTFRDQWVSWGSNYVDQSYYLATTSDNGATWNIGYVFEINPELEVWYDKDIIFTTVDVGQPNLRVAWVYKANTDGSVNLRWQIDDVKITKVFAMPDGEDEEEIVDPEDDSEITLPNTGVTIQFIGAVPSQTINSKRFNIKPDVDIESIQLVGGGDSPVTNIAPVYWNIVSTAGEPGNYSITFDLTGVPGIVIPAELKLLKRANAASPWIDYGSPETPAELPLLTWTGLDSFSDFAIGGFGTNTLPVELSSFTANITANMFVELQWVAETETNMLGYYVYRSTDNSISEADKINSIIIPAHNSSSTTEYSYLDEDVYPGETYFYWLQNVDLDLTSNFHGPVTVTLQEEVEIPEPEYVTALRRNYPNPFNPETTIKFSLRDDVEMMELKIYNVLGQVVRTLVHAGPYAKGEHKIVWDGTNDSGRSATSGIYFYRMTTPNYNKIHKMMMLK